MSSQFEQVYRVTPNSEMSASFWNGVLRNIDQRFIAIEEKKASFEEAERQLLEVGLKRINETIGPAAQTILAVAELGFQSASSEALLHPLDGQELTVPLIKDERARVFTPSPFIALVRRSTPDGYAIGKLLHFDREQALLHISIVSCQGITQGFDDFDVAALAGSVKAMWDALQESRSIRDEVSVKHGDIAQKSTDITAKHADIGEKHSDFVSTWYGASYQPPDGAKIGAMYLDISQNPAVVMVKTASGWTIAALAADNVYTKLQAEDKFYSKAQADEKFLTQENAQFLPLSGNAVSATTATKLATPRTITILNQAREFDGTENISWDVAELGFVSNKAADGSWGWMRRPDGIIEQWGKVDAGIYSTIQSGTIVTFPLAFPLKCAQIFLEGGNRANTAYSVNPQETTKTQFTVNIQYTAGTGYQLNILYWRAIGW